MASILALIAPCCLVILNVWIECIMALLINGFGWSIELIFGVGMLHGYNLNLIINDYKLIDLNSNFMRD